MFSLTECTVQLVLSLKGGGKCKFTMDEDMLDEKYNYDFTNLKDDGKRFVRGGRKYIRPYGWKRVALNVKEKYDDTERIGGVKGTNHQNWECRQGMAGVLPWDQGYLCQSHCC